MRENANDILNGVDDANNALKKLGFEKLGALRKEENCENYYYPLEDGKNFIHDITYSLDVKNSTYTIQISMNIYKTIKSAGKESVIYNPECRNYTFTITGFKIVGAEGDKIVIESTDGKHKVECKDEMTNELMTNELQVLSGEKISLPLTYKGLTEELLSKDKSEERLLFSEESSSDISAEEPENSILGSTFYTETPALQKILLEIEELRRLASETESVGELGLLLKYVAFLRLSMSLIRQTYISELLLEILQEIRIRRDRILATRNDQAYVKQEARPSRSQPNQLQNQPRTLLGLGCIEGDEKSCCGCCYL